LEKHSRQILVFISEQGLGLARAIGQSLLDYHRERNSRRLMPSERDEFTVPVCRVHHRELHRSGDEATWRRKLDRII
jgi:hypothetical protein